MILRKPYVFFVKVFRPLHLILSVLVVYLITLSNRIIQFLNQYIYSVETSVSSETVEGLLSPALYVIPLILISFFVLFLGVMYRKEKPILFYFAGIFSFLVVLVVNVYANSFLNVLLENIIAVKTVKLIHDIMVIALIIEIVYFLLMFSRGIGLDFKKFEFNSDLTKLEADDKDNEEFEFNINIDFETRRRKRRARLRQLKYFYLENKLMVNVSIVIVVLILSLIFGIGIYKRNQGNVEGVYYNFQTFNFKINKTYFTDRDYKGNKINDNYLLIIDFDIKTKEQNDFLHLNDFTLNIEDIKFKPTTKYNDSLIDLGLFYEEQILSYDYTSYLMVFELPRKYTNSDMTLSYNSLGNAISVHLSPQKMSIETFSEQKMIGEKMSFGKVLPNVEFKISEYSINSAFVIEYNFCIKKDDCYLSREYLKPSLDENYDKVILKLIVDYKSDSELNLNNFSKFILNYGFVSYKINDAWYSDYKIEQIISKKKNIANEVYLGVNSNIVNAESIKLSFNIRGSKYDYILK